MGILFVCLFVFNHGLGSWPDGCRWVSAVSKAEMILDQELAGLVERVLN